MKIIVLLLFMIATAGYGQSSLDGKYGFHYVIKYARKNKLNATATTKEIIAALTKQFDGDQEQVELITFYQDAYDLKLVDKAILKHLIDSLSDHAATEEIKTLANSTRTAIEFRLLNKPMRDFALPDKVGNIVRLSSFRDKIVVIELWASWCGPCKKEMPKIPGLLASNADLAFYSISLDKTPEAMKKFIEKNKYNWPLVFGGYSTNDNPNELWDYFHIVAIPKYYVINREGIVTHIADKLDVEFLANLH